MRAIYKKGMICSTSECGKVIPRDQGGIELDDGSIVCGACFQQFHDSIQGWTRSPSGKILPKKPAKKNPSQKQLTV